MFTSFVLAGLALFGGHHHASLPAAQIAENSTVVVVGNLEESAPNSPSLKAINATYCSGVLMAHVNGYDVVVTARHCAEKTVGDDGDTLTPQPALVKFADGVNAKVQAWVAAPYDDLAFLFVTPTNKPLIALSADPVLRNVNYFAFGMPEGNMWASTPATALQGNMPSNAQEQGGIWSQALTYTCPGCGPGDSGGGMYDESGKLVGITVAGVGNYTLVIPTQRVENALQYAILTEVMHG